MAMDAQVNFGFSTVATAPATPTAGTSLTVASGTGGRFPVVPFNVIVSNGTTSEIVRVTARSGDAFTIVRAQEGFSARSITVGDTVYSGDTKNTWDQARDQHGLDVRTVGARSDGATGTANNAAWLSVLNTAEAGAYTLPYSVAEDPVGTKTIRIPAGVYEFTTAGSFLGQEGMVGKVAGIHFVGEGDGSTHIIFHPSAAADFMNNDYWLHVTFEGISFYAATAGCTLFHPSTTHNAQRYRFLNCSFYGWRYIGYLEGNNNNSEWTFLSCFNYFMAANGAWIRIPTTGSDQFLNFWWYGGGHWSTSAPVIDAELGGHFKIHDLDVSDWGVGLTSLGYLFKMRGTTHAYGACSLLVEGLRWEAKNAFCSVLYSEWPMGHITFNDFDMSSQEFAYTYGTKVIDIKYSNNDGASVVFRNSWIVGGVNVAFQANDWQHNHSIKFYDCTFAQKTSPTDVVTYDTSGASVNVYTTPPVEFIGCRGEVTADAFSGQVVWDAIVGWRGEMVQTLVQRVLSVRGVYGTNAGTDVTKVRLPVGAMITGFEALSPSGGSAEADGGTWTLATTDATPVTIATATVSGAMSAGYAVVATPATPFDCSTAAKATVTITPGSVSTANPKAVLLIKGYW